MQDYVSSVLICRRLKQFPFSLCLNCKQFQFITKLCIVVDMQEFLRNRRAKGLPDLDFRHEYRFFWLLGFSATCNDRISSCRPTVLQPAAFLRTDRRTKDNCFPAVVVSVHQVFTVCSSKYWWGDMYTFKRFNIKDPPISITSWGAIDLDIISVF